MSAKRIIWTLFLALLLSVPCALSSSGDRAEDFQRCISSCQVLACASPQSTPLPLALRLTRWTCVDDCKYGCMHHITNRAIEHDMPVQQYFGKWPFWRLAGMQEPASVLFSLFNFAAHYWGARKIRRKVSDGHPMKAYYLTFAYTSMNAWVWSSVFHTRDLPSTEKLDYFSAALAIVYALYYTVIRLFHLHQTESSYRLTAPAPHPTQVSSTHAVWTICCSLVYVLHVMYLILLPRFDYAYNIMFNVAVGLSHNLLWIFFSLPVSLRRYPSRPKTYKPAHVLKPGLCALLTTAATALELFDFPPWGRIIDAHSLWHLATAPIAVLWYTFLLEDALDDGWRVQKL